MLVIYVCTMVESTRFINSLVLDGLWLDRADKVIMEVTNRSFSILCSSYSDPSWTKLGRSGILRLSYLRENNVYTYEGALVFQAASQYNTGVYFCNGTYRNGSSLYRVYLLYVGCKFS